MRNSFKYFLKIPKMEQHKIIIVDDHLLFAQGLKLVLENNAKYIVSEIVDELDKVMQNVKTFLPEIILLDVNVNGINSKDICENITVQFPKIKVIVISMHHEFNIIREMKRAGAKGYILKNTSQEQIFKALEQVVTGKEYFEEEVSNILTQGQNAHEFNLEQLNPREKKILALILKDKTNKKIAENLGLSIKTIEFYRTSLYIKLDVKNIIQLVQKVQKMNYWNEL
jgi:two-component system, NarL family, nitrate/nitrite response regulator NarL